MVLNLSFQMINLISLKDVNMKMKKFIFIMVSLCLFFCVVSCSSGNEIEVTKYGTPEESVISANISFSDNDVILQGFSWDSCNVGSWWTYITNNSTEIGDNFEYVWFPPASDSLSPNGYLPRQLNLFTSSYGSEMQLKDAISAISPAKAIADIVINHRCGTTSWGDFTNPPFGTVKGSNYQAICSDDEGFLNDINMKGVSSSMREAADTGDKYGAGRDLDHTNSTVQSGIVDWMKSLKTMGFVGWRYDYVKGYAGKYVGKYNKETSAEISFGEYWPTTGYSSTNPLLWKNEITQWINATMEENGQVASVFDFTLKGAFNTVFGTNTRTSNKNYSLLADSSNFVISNPKVAITFVDNHDTGSTQALWPIDSEDVGTAYVYILTHPGIPCVAWQHYFSGVKDSVCSTTVPGTTQTLHNHIKYLINLRKTLGITNLSVLENLSSTSSLYAAKIKGSNKSIIVSIGNDNYTCPIGFRAIYSGNNWIIYIEETE